jgi:hypothetical protein
MSLPRRRRQAVAGEGIGTAQGIGYPVTAGHLADEVGSYRTG